MHHDNTHIVAVNFSKPRKLFGNSSHRETWKHKAASWKFLGEKTQKANQKTICPNVKKIEWL